MSNLTKIKINNARFFAFHGVLDYEKKYGNGFEADIEMNCDLSALGDTDELKNTVDYSAVYKLLDKLMNEEKFHLIETVNQNICKNILENFPQVQSVKVSIRKPNAPLGLIDSVEIETKMKRGES